VDVSADDFSAADARYAAEWLEAIGALNDADYAAALVRHCAALGYGPARWREELRRHGLNRELWEDAMDAGGDPAELAGRYLQDRFRGGAPDEAERRRAAAALARRGFAWGDVKAALAAWGAETEDAAT
jgi:regulatory protein